LRAFAAARDWDSYHTPKNLVMALSAEVGELTDLFQWLTPEESARVMDDADTAHRLIRASLPEHVAAITGPPELEGMRRRLIDRPPALRGLGREDYLAAVGIFLLVVGATFPVVIPFLATSDLALAMQLSRAITLAMLFAAGLVLGRHAGHAHPVRTGLLMLLLGAALITAVKALGG